MEDHLIAAFEGLRLAFVGFDAKELEDVALNAIKRRKERPS